MSGEKKNIVCIGGGNGTPRVLRALKNHDVNLTAVITMADSGGSAGFLREHYGTLPTGDIRRALAALATTDSPLKNLMMYRFQGGPLDTQSAGSLFLTSMENVLGSFEKAVDATANLLGIKGSVLPVTLDNVHLCAEFEDGGLVRGEHQISSPEYVSKRVRRIWLEPEASANPRVLSAIAEADVVVIGPGGFYHSLIPNLLVKGIAEAINASRARRVYIENLEAQIPDFDYVAEIKRYVTIDTVLPPSIQSDTDTLSHGILTL